MTLSTLRATVMLSTIILLQLWDDNDDDDDDYMVMDGNAAEGHDGTDYNEEHHNNVIVCPTECQNVSHSMG
jgi:hypothetical protein